MFDFHDQNKPADSLDMVVHSSVHISEIVVKLEHLEKCGEWDVQDQAYGVSLPALVHCLACRSLGPAASKH